MVICNGMKYRSLKDFIYAEMLWLYKSGKTYKQIAEVFEMTTSWTSNVMNGRSNPIITPQVEKGLERLGYRIIIEPIKNKAVD